MTRKYRLTHIGDHKLHPETQMMGYGYDPHLSEGALKTPIFQTSTFVFKNAQDGKDFFAVAYGKRKARPHEDPGLIYSRINNPDFEVLEDRLALWESAEDALSFSSGMAAISTSLWTFLRPGDVILHSAPIYGGTEFLIRNILPQFGIVSEAFEASIEGPTLLPALERALGKGRVGAIYIETPANPTNGLVDIRAAADAAKKVEAETGHCPPVIVDNTFLGPLFQHPLDHGADLVIYSLTKYVAGHSDVVAGAVVGNESMVASIRGMRTILGTMCDPQTTWLILRSLETLKLRMNAASDNAKELAAYLQGHPKVEFVHYLGFLTPGMPAFDLYTRQCTAAGATFAFDIVGGEKEAFAVLDALQLIKLAVSLGGTESLMQHPYSMTHADVPDDVKIRLGITPSMLRLSVGIENASDMIADLNQALRTL